MKPITIGYRDRIYWENTKKLSNVFPHEFLNNFFLTFVKANNLKIREINKNQYSLNTFENHNMIKIFNIKSSMSLGFSIYIQKLFSKKVTILIFQLYSNFITLDRRLITFDFILKLPLSQIKSYWKLFLPVINYSKNLVTTL